MISESADQNKQIVGWKRVASGGLEVHRIRGDHDSYLREHAENTAAVLKNCIETAQTNETL